MTATTTDQRDLGQTVYDLLAAAPGRALACGDVMRAVHAAGFAVGPGTVFALPFVDCRLIGELVEEEAFALVRGARRPR